MLDVSDRLEILEVLHRYPEIVDYREGYRSAGNVFADDARFDADEFGCGVWQGLPEIQKFFSHWPKRPGESPDLQVISHNVVNALVSQLKSDGTVRCQSRCVVILIDAPPVTAVYLDTFRKTEKGWRIASRRVQAISPENTLTWLSDPAVDTD